MIKFASSTKPVPAAKAWQVVGYGLGLLATALAVAQMVSFEEFVVALQQYRVVGEQASVALAIALIALEIFSVPFLFRLSSSRLARWLSALCVVLLPCIWTALTIAVLLDGLVVSNAGYFGGFLEVQVGAMVLVLNVAWMSAVGVSFGPLGGEKALRVR